MKRSVRVFVLAMGLMWGQVLGAQAIKEIYVSQEEPYTDHIALAQDSRDTDVMVKFQYNEEKNALTVSVISYRNLFVFREPARYGSLINFWGKVVPAKFPYVVSSEPKAKFRFSPELKKSIKGPRSKYIFNKWIEYSGLQPQPTEYAMVNDFIEQSFDVLPGNKVVSVTLRDIYLMNGRDILCGKDLKTRFDITIGHNPCFGKEEEISEATTTLENLFNNYNSLKASSNNGIAESQELADMFAQLKEAVRTQFLPKEVKSSCPAVQNIWDVYNDFVDSVAVMKCVYAPRRTGVDEQIIRMSTRAIDDNVSRWLLSNDPIEKRDLAAAIEETIQDTEALVKANGLIDEAQTKAYALFCEAVKYSRKIVK